MGRATRRGKSYAGLAAAGAALMGGANFLDKQQQARAQALREKRLMELKDRELDLSQKRLDASTNAQTTADQRDAVNKFLDKDVPEWRSRFIGDDKDADLREAAWKEALSFGGVPETPEEMADLKARIDTAFGPGADGKPLISEAQLKDGLKYLTARAEMRGVDPAMLTPERLQTIISSGFDIQQGGDAGVDTAAATDPNAPGVDIDAPLMGDAPKKPSGPAYGTLSEILYGRGNEATLRNKISDATLPVADMIEGGINWVSDLGGRAADMGMFGLMDAIPGPAPRQDENSSRLYRDR